MCSLAAVAERPNIIVIMTDDSGYADLGCYGGEIDTPHLDSLAQEGMRFKNFYNEGRCSPTRATLMSGPRTLSEAYRIIPAPLRIWAF